VDRIPERDWILIKMDCKKEALRDYEEELSD